MSPDLVAGAKRGRRGRLRERDHTGWESGGKPLPLGGGDDLLRVFWKLFQKGGAARAVQLPKSVVQQQDWGRSKMGFQQPCCRKTQREDEGALLAF